MAVDEQELEKRFQQGDKGAFDELFDKHERPLKYFIYGIKEMRYQYDRDDLSQKITNDALLQAMDRRDQFDPKKSKFTTWLHEIAKNLLRDELRKRRRNRELIRKTIPAMGVYSDPANFSFLPPDEQDKEYVPKTRKEKRKRLYCSDLDKSTKRLFGRIVAYGWNFDGVKLSPRERKIIALTDKYTPKNEIARKLGMSIPACDTAICRIIKKLPVEM